MPQMMTPMTCKRARPLQSAPLLPATITPPRLPLARGNPNALALISSLARKCPEAMYCVVAPLVLGCVLVFNGFQLYNNDKRKRTM